MTTIKQIQTCIRITKLW